MQTMAIDAKESKKTKIEGIRKRSDGKYLVRVDWVDEVTGQRKYRRKLAKTLSEAVKLRETLKGSEPSLHPERVRFTDFVEQWLKLRCLTLAGSTTDRYVSSCAHLAQHFGQFWVDALTPDHVKTWLRKEQANNAPATLNGHLRILREIIKDAADKKNINKEDARSVVDVSGLREGPTKGRRGRSLGPDQACALIRAIEVLSRHWTRDKDRSRFAISPDIARILLTGLWTGCRRGELFALKWQDYQQGELYVMHSVYKRTEKSVKTDDPRIVTVVEPLALVLEEQRKWLLERQHPGLASGLIFPASPRGAKAGRTRRENEARKLGLTGDEVEIAWYRSPSCLSKPLIKACNEAQVPEISPHAFRRTFERLLRKAGVDQLVRRSLAGWASEGAQDIYGIHSVDRSERAAAGAAIVELVYGKGNKQ